MDVRVVGGGLYGVAIALRLDRGGHDVRLDEKEPELLRGASGANQWRLHEGYHYPRSEATARECKEGARRFREEFPDAVVTGDDHYYCIASDRSKTSPGEFLDHCDRLGLPYERELPPTVDDDAVDLGVRVPEHRVDPGGLRRTCLERLRASDVRVHRNSRVRPDEVGADDATVVATYANINGLVEAFPELRRQYKYELVEKPVVELPERFRDTSTVVMDGPFMCYDPLGRSDRFLLGNVVHSVHDRTVGYRPAFGDRYRDLLFEGLLEEPPVTHVDRFREHGDQFFPGIGDAEWLGSYFTVRTVLPGVEDTDARLTHVTRQDNVFTVLAGKLASCLDAADEVADRLPILAK